uniref:rhodanese domain-containing protein CG4456-like n=1 Tax=Myxine glutinosa TaxID=7769 RepID=UPI00358E5A65
MALLRLPSRMVRSAPAFCRCLSGGRLPAGRTLPGGFLACSPRIQGSFLPVTARAQHIPAGVLSQVEQGTGEIEVPYKELKRLIDQDEAFIIDVRENWELKEYGFIPGSLNIPLENLEKALSFSEREFMALYGIKPPGQNHNDIVFLCRAGRRSRTAIEIATIRGYARARHYPGGWLDWDRQEQENTLQ